MVPDFTRFEPLRVMAMFATYLRAGRGSKPVWFRGPKASPKVPVIYGATSIGPNPKLMMTLKKLAPPPLRRTRKRAAVLGGQRLTKGWYWGTAVNRGVVLGGQRLTEGWYWGDSG